MPSRIVRGWSPLPGREGVKTRHIIHNQHQQDWPGRAGQRLVGAECPTNPLVADDAQGREDGPPVVCMPRHLALFYPENTLGRGALASKPRPFSQIQIRARGVPPSPPAARHGVEPRSSLRHAASHSHLRRVVFLVSTQFGRVLSDRKRFALPVKFQLSQHTACKLMNAAKTVHLERPFQCLRFRYREP